jgi:RNA polymerase sigma-70 factor (ECF subfamily)
MLDQNTLANEMPKLRKFALKLTRNASDADDLTQATVLRAIEKQEHFEHGTNIFAWTSKIMYNMFVTNYRRRTKFETQYDPEHYIEEQVMKAPQESIIAFSEARDALQNISEDHRQILMMVCVNNMQYSEVSEILQIPLGTVRSRLSRARESMQQALNTPRHTPSLQHLSGRMSGGNFMTSP